MKPPETSLVTYSVEETEALAGSLAGLASAGLVVALQGDLGAGKTAFTRGFARGLGFKGRVHSPTFALVNEYAGGRWPVTHLDLYRLNSSDEVRSAGLDEYLLRPRGVTVVEWPERWLEGSTKTSSWRNVWLRLIDENRREIRHDWSATPRH